MIKLLEDDKFAEVYYFQSEAGKKSGSVLEDFMRENLQQSR